MNSRAISVSGLTRGTKFRLYHSVPFGANQGSTSQKSREKRNSQINKDTLRNFCDGHIDDGTAKAELGGKDGNENPSVEGVEKDLEKRIEGHQASRIFRIASRQFVPHDDHRDAACETDHDQSSHVFRISAQEDDGQNKHQNRPDNPVLHERKAEHALVAKDLVQFSYRTFVKGGYIIKINPAAIGMEVVPMLKRFRNGTTPGTSQPNTTPATMAAKIQAVR